MRIDIVTAFPYLAESPIEESIIKQARHKKLVDINIHDLRKFSSDKHHKVDDYPYGGGPGMVMKPEPFFRCVDHIYQSLDSECDSKIIYLSPQGRVFNQQIANELVEESHLVFLCGHYKGIDERVIEGLVTDEISLGDYVLTGGELPALVIMDAVIRLIPGAISDIESATTDSFQQKYLDCPYYTRPDKYRGMKVPEVLLSGHHENIQKWRKEQSIDRTMARRKDLIKENVRKNTN